MARSLHYELIQGVKKVSLTTENFNQIPFLLNNDLLTTKQAVAYLADEILSNPKYYQIHEQDEDVLGELLLKIFQSAENLFKKFDSNAATFKVYFNNFIFYQLKTIKRNLYRTKLQDESAMFQKQIDYENQQDLYYSYEYDNKLLSEPAVSDNKHDYDLKDKYENIRAFFNDRKHQRKEKTIIILALKSCFYITDDLIKNISKYCRISEAELTEMIYELRDELKERKAKLEKIKQRRDKEYFLKRSLQDKLASKEIKIENSELVEKKIELHTYNWLKTNQMLFDGVCKIVPSNAKISSLLGICERQIGNYLKNSKNMENIL